MTIGEKQEEGVGPQRPGTLLFRLVVFRLVVFSRPLGQIPCQSGLFANVCRK